MTPKQSGFHSGARFDRLLRIHTEAGTDRPPYDADGVVEEVRRSIRGDAG